MDYMRTEYDKNRAEYERNTPVSLRTFEHPPNRPRIVREAWDIFQVCYSLFLSSFIIHPCSIGGDEVTEQDHMILTIVLKILDSGY